MQIGGSVLGISLAISTRRYGLSQKLGLANQIMVDILILGLSVSGMTVMAIDKILNDFVPERANLLINSIVIILDLDDHDYLCHLSKIY